MHRINQQQYFHKIILIIIYKYGLGQVGEEVIVRRIAMRKNVDIMEKIVRQLRRLNKVTC